MPKGVYKHKSKIMTIVMNKPEVRAKCSKAKKGTHLSEEHRKNISKALKGKIPKNLSLINANKFGRNNPMFGEKRTDEWKEEHSRKLSGKMPKNIMESGSFGHIKRGYYDINGESIFFRSKWEANIALYLNFLIKQKQILSWSYEKRVFIFNKIKFGTRSYRPDFEIVNNDNGLEYWEVKGYMIPQSKTQMKRFKKYYPEEFNKLRFVIYDPFSRSKESGEMVNFFLEDLGISFDRLISYREIKGKLGTLIPGWE